MSLTVTETTITRTPREIPDYLRMTSIKKKTPPEVFHPDYSITGSHLRNRSKRKLTGGLRLDGLPTSNLTGWNPSHSQPNTANTLNTLNTLSTSNTTSISKALILDHTPLSKAPTPLFTRVLFFIQFWILRVLHSIRLWRRTRNHHSAQETQPDLTKRYPCRPKLPVHIFYPPNYKAPLSPSSSPRTPALPYESKHLYPLYIHINSDTLFTTTTSSSSNHNQKHNHHFARSWSTRTGTLVATLTPSTAFPHPTPAEDIAALSAALINDPSIPIDKSRIVVSGAGFGALLALSAAQLAPLQGKIKAVVAYYPIVDLSVDHATKLAMRLDQSRLEGEAATLSWSLEYAYVPVGQNRRDKVLSPAYARADELPDHVCVVGAQHDMFCREARDTIFRLAGRDESEYGMMFETVNYKCIYAEGMEHGFLDGIGRDHGSETEKEIRDKFCERMFDDIHHWLVENVFSSVQEDYLNFGSKFLL